MVTFCGLSRSWLLSKTTHMLKQLSHNQRPCGIRISLGCGLRKRRLRRSHFGRRLTHPFKSRARSPSLPGKTHPNVLPLTFEPNGMQPMLNSSTARNMSGFLSEWSYSSNVSLSEYSILPSYKNLLLTVMSCGSPVISISNR